AKIDGGLALGTDNALGGNSIAFGDNDTGLKQNGDGLLDVYANGQHVFRFQNGALQSNRAVNVSGRVTPSDYGNFDARYQTKTGGVQDVRLGGAIGIGRGGNAPSGHLISGLDGGESMDWANARPVQVLINGVWRNVASL
ncbi:phage tail protein, partial [Escherichia coli]